MKNQFIPSRKKKPGNDLQAPIEASGNSLDFGDMGFEPVEHPFGEGTG